MPCHNPIPSDDGGSHVQLRPSAHCQLFSGLCHLSSDLYHLSSDLCRSQANAFTPLIEFHVELYLTGSVATIHILNRREFLQPFGKGCTGFVQDGNVPVAEFN